MSVQKDLDNIFNFVGPLYNYNKGDLEEALKFSDKPEDRSYIRQGIPKVLASSAAGGILGSSASDLSGLNTKKITEYASTIPPSDWVPHPTRKGIMVPNSKHSKKILSMKNIPSKLGILSGATLLGSLMAATVLTPKHRDLLARKDKELKDMYKRTRSPKYRKKLVEAFNKEYGIQKVSAVLTARGRNQIKQGNFALAGRRYPIHDRSHARNALSRVSQHGTPSEKGTVRAAVRKKYPTMSKEANTKMSKYKAYKKKQSKYLGSDKHIKNQALGSFIGLGGATAIPTFMGTHFYNIGKRIAARKDLHDSFLGKTSKEIASDPKILKAVRDLKKIESLPNYLKKVIAPTVLAGTVVGGIAAHKTRKRIKKAFPKGPLG